MHRLLALVAMSIALAGCGSSPGVDVSGSLPAPIDPSLLPALAHRDRELPAAVLAADAFDPDALAELLGDAGYVGGRERELTGHTDTFDHVVARTLRFDGADGAVRDLEWIAGHTIDLVGRTRRRDPLPLGDDARLYELEPCSMCKKQLPTLLATWRRGGAVGYLLASGRDADRESLRPLAAEVDGSLGRGS